MGKITLLFYILVNNCVMSFNNKNNAMEQGKKVSLQLLPFFRRQVEENNENTCETEPGIAEYPSQRIVNLLIANAEDIFEPSKVEIKNNVDNEVLNDPIFNEIFIPIKSEKHENLLNSSANNKDLKNNFEQSLEKLPGLVFKRVNQERFDKNSQMYPWYMNIMNNQENKIFKIDKLLNPKQSYVNKQKKYLDLKDNLVKALDKRFIYTNHVEDSDLSIDDEYLPDVVDNLQHLINALKNRKNSSDIISNRSYTGQPISIANESKEKDFEERMMELDQKYSFERTSFPMITQTNENKIEATSKNDILPKNTTMNYKNSTINKSEAIIMNKDDIFHHKFPFIRTRHFMKSNENTYLEIFPYNNDTTLTVHDQDTNKINNVSLSNVTEVSQAGVSDVERKLSCIRCNNAVDNWCSAPNYKLIPSAICERENDICYSMHTPFGIINRGCYNTVHNMSVYVCGCDLCNYMPFTELPMMFTSKQNWIQNVHELAHLRSLRRKTFGKLSCLKCEVNGTEGGATIDDDDTNCLEGHLPALQTVLCSGDEVCGVRAARKLGYIWRGCVSAPLYNYYITLCSEDLCNLDPIVSLYDDD